MILVGQKDKTQAVERPPGDVHLRLVAVDVINGLSLIHILTLPTIAAECSCRGWGGG